MLTPFVNGLTVLPLTVATATACSNADGRARAEAPPPVDSLSTKADLGRIDGNPKAKVWVVEVSDLQCPYCKAWHDEAYEKIKNEFVKTGKVRFAFVNFPLSQHQHAQAAAVAAMCASAQGKFWPMHTAIFATQSEWDRLPNAAAHFESLAVKTGVNLAQWKSCLTAPAVTSLIAADMDRAKRAGVQSTPSFIVGGKLLEGAVPADELSKAINDALKGSK